jgi:hypothetical protein
VEMISTVRDPLITSMDEVCKSSLRLIQNLPVELLLRLPAEEFKKLEEIMEQDKTALQTALQPAIQSLIFSSSGHHPDIYTKKIPELIKKSRANLLVDYNNNKYYNLVKYISNDKLHLSSQLGNQLLSDSRDPLLRRLNLDDYSPPNNDAKYGEKEVMEAKTLMYTFGTFAKKINQAIDGIHRKIGEQLGEGINEVFIKKLYC